MEKNYQKTIYACFLGYIVQAIVVNFAPLLFLTFQQTWQIPLAQITLLVTVNFTVQLLVDLLSVTFVDKIGYRAAMVLAHGFAAVGLVAMAVLPGVLPSPFTGLMAAVVLYAIGGGLLEVLVSPVMESCPTPHKAKAMSLLHAFYCWGQVGVVLISTVFFAIFGVSSWRVLALLWALLPLCNGLVFLRVPMAPLLPEGQKGMTLRELFGKKLFWVLMLMMLCAGASEQSIAQWASTFAEKGLGVGKTLGDLAGPMTFALAMGITRAFYGKRGDKLDLDRFMGGSAVLCMISYLCVALVPSPVVGLLGCTLCGFSVGIMWPGTFSKGAEALRGGGTALFALMALAGDLGCSSGPTLVGIVSGAAGDDLRMGILAAIVFPAALLVGVALLRKQTRAKKA